MIRNREGSIERPRSRRLAAGLAMIALAAGGVGIPVSPASAQPQYGDAPPPEPPNGYGPSDQSIDTQSAQVQANLAYERAVERWSAANCVRERNNNVAAGAVIGGVLGAITGGAIGRGGGAAAVGGVLGATAGAAVGASTTSPGCPPGFVVRPGAPTFVYAPPPGWGYAAPPDYRPWVLVNGRWVYRPYPYHRYWRRRYWH